MEVLDHWVLQVMTSCSRRIFRDAHTISSCWNSVFWQENLSAWHSYVRPGNGTMWMLSSLSTKTHKDTASRQLSLVTV
jgi:hypothetical protein